MRKILFLIALISASSFATGQTDSSPRGTGYFFGAIGGIVDGGPDQAFWQFGGGGEVGFSNGMAAGIDLGYLTAAGSDFSGGLGILSAGLSYDFKTDSKTSPFVTGGYSLLFRNDVGNGFHFGGGVRHWFSERWGLKVEIRDVVFRVFGNSHLIMGRVSILVR